MLGASKNSVSWVTMTIILTNIGLGILVAWAFLRFGSLTAAAAYVAGDRLLVDKTNKSFGRVIQGDTPSVEFALYNTTSKPVAIIGVSSSCTCVVVEDLPLTIPPSSNVSLRAKILTEGKSGPITGALKAYTDYNDQPIIELNVRGNVDEGGRS